MFESSKSYFGLQWFTFKNFKSLFGLQWLTLKSSKSSFGLQWSRLVNLGCIALGSEWVGANFGYRLTSQG
jgi:hypothetical protein